MTESHDYKICGKYRVKDNEAYSVVSCCYLKCLPQSFVKSVHILPPYNKIHKAGRWRWNVSAISPFPTRLFYKMRTSTTVNTHGRLVEIGIPQIWKPMKLHPGNEVGGVRELEEENGRQGVCWSDWHRSRLGRANEACSALYKINHWVTYWTSLATVLISQQYWIPNANPVTWKRKWWWLWSSCGSACSKND